MPAPLGFRVRASGQQRRRELTSNNVVAEIPGTSKQRIVLAAHLDHLGTAAGSSGDTIYNGAIDNGSAVASLMLVARALKERQRELYFSVTVLASNAEESGLLGSKHYVQQTDRRSIVANITFESTPVWGAARSIMGIGARFSTLEDTLKVVAARQGLAYTEFSMIDQGFFYRSDQFAFASYGIPSVWISAGEDDASGQRRYPAFWRTAYHTVKDEYDPGWSLEGLAQTVESTVLLVEELNRTRTAPRWKRALSFPVHGP